MSETKQTFTWFEIVLNDWREEYDRESGLGIVVAIADIEKNTYWVAKIIRDEKGYFIVPEVVYRSGKCLTKTDHKIEDIPINFKSKK